MGVSRRRLLQFGALAGVGIAIPAVQHFSWNARDFTRTGYDPSLPVAPEGETSWMNWSGVQRATPKSFFYPSTTDEVAAHMRATTGRVRPVGSGHSFTGLAPSEGMMVDASALEGMFAYDAATGEATFGAGTRLFHVASALDEVGRALPNLPDIDVQTLAGSFATGTHGTGNTLSALHDYITAFQLVTANGEVMDVTETSHPELFGAGKVSLGALGIMTQFTIRTVPQFNLHRQMVAEEIDPFFEKIEDLAKAHRNFEFYYFPATRMVAYITHDLYEGPIEDRDRNDDDEFLEGLKQLRDKVGWFPWLRRYIAQSEFPRGIVEDVTDESWALLSTTRPIKFNEMEYHLPREHGVETLRKITRMLDQRKNIYFPMEYRHIAPDTAWLSPFNDGPRSSIAIHAAVDEPYDYFFSDFEPVYRKVGGRPHWGKHHSLKKDDFMALYPKFGDFLTVRKELDPTGRFLNPHLAGIFGEAFDG